MTADAPLLSVATICFDGFGDEDFAPTFEFAPQLGVRSIEFNAWYPRNLTPEGIDGILERCDATGLLPATLQVSSFAPGPAAHDLTREVSRWLWLFEAAQRLGVRVVKATGAARGEAGGLESIVALLRLIAPVAEERGLLLAVENHADNVLETPEDYRRLLDAVTSPAVGMCFDTGHFAASGFDLLDVADEFGDRIVHIDLKDCAGEGGAFTRFGDGVVDFAAVLALPTRAEHVVVELPLLDRTTMLADLRAGVAVAERSTRQE